MCSILVQDTTGLELYLSEFVQNDVAEILSQLASCSHQQEQIFAEPADHLSQWVAHHLLASLELKRKLCSRSWTDL